MGTFYHTLEVGDPNGAHFETVEALVDTGASYTSLPASILHRLGVNPIERWPFVLSDGSQVELDIGFTFVRIDDKTGMTLVVFGDEGKQPILGWHTLDGLFLKGDPENQRLVPIESIPWHEHPRPVLAEGD